MFGILRVSTSLGTKFQQILLRRIEARACLRKGVDVALHVVHANCMARSVSACLSWRDATFFGQHRTSALQLKSSHHKIFESHATGCAGDTGILGWLSLGQQVRGSSNQAPRHRS